MSIARRTLVRIDLEWIKEMEKKEKRHRIFKWIIFLLLIMILCLIITKEKENKIDWATLYSYGDICEKNTRINVQNINNENVLIFPSTVFPSKVNLYFDSSNSADIIIKGNVGSICFKSGDTLDLTKLCDGEEFDFTFEEKGNIEGSKYKVRFLFSGNIPAMYLISDYALNKGRRWVESSVNKSNKATGCMVMQNAKGSIVYNGLLTQIKGRGNSTWSYEKRPYQIKLKYKEDLLESGNEDNRAKTWVLLANYLDPTLMRNTIALNLEDALGMDAKIESIYVDLYYDGEYRGNYLLAEKVEIGKGRVDIIDLDELNKIANYGVELENLSIGIGNTENGATYTYCIGMKSPDNITGGYLLERDFAVRAVEETCYFYTARNNYIVVKSPKYASEAEMSYIATLYQEFEDALYNNGVNSYTGKVYSDYMNLESLVQSYLINEISRNQDAFISSSFFYKEADCDCMYMGPLWDFDYGFGLGFSEQGTIWISPEKLYAAATDFGEQLCKLEDFRNAVKEMYEISLSPIMEKVVLSDGDSSQTDSSLNSILYYKNLLQDSAVCNELLWHSANSWHLETDMLYEFVFKRTEYMKKLFSSGKVDNSNYYIDILYGNWYYEDVYKAEKYGLMSGVGEHFFDANSYVQRSQAVQAIYNMADKPVTKYEQIFTDVNQNEWYSTAVTWAANNGIVNRYYDTTFRPTQVIAREDILCFLYNYIECPVTDTSIINNYEDANLVSEYAKNAIEWAFSEEILIEDEKNYIRPQEGVSRAELASILVRFYEKYML